MSKHACLLKNGIRKNSTRKKHENKKILPHISLPWALITNLDHLVRMIRELGWSWIQPHHTWPTLGMSGRAGLTSVSSPVEANVDLCPGFIQTPFPAQRIHRKITARSATIIALLQTRALPMVWRCWGSTVVFWGQWTSQYLFFPPPMSSFHYAA